jgi:DNA topoisomerase I
VRLRRSSPDDPGWSRRRRGRGFSFVDEAGRRLDGQQRQRCLDLIIPPAWTDVWICPWPDGHIQAVGTDSAGRRQYLYHPQWRAEQDAAKHERALELGRSLSAARRRVSGDLGLPGTTRPTALAAAFRMLDLGLLRIGGEEYAEGGSFGLATVRRDHVRLRDDQMTLQFTAKSGVEQQVVLRDAALVEAVRPMYRRRSGGADLLAYREGRAWTDVVSSDINEYVRDVTGADVTAKYFRTWHATVRAAAGLAAAEAAAATKGQRRAVVQQVMAQVAEDLGNTPAVARSSYVDPRVVEMYRAGTTVEVTAAENVEAPDERVEQAVIDLLSGGQASRGRARTNGSPRNG